MFGLSVAPSTSKPSSSAKSASGSGTKKLVAPEEMDAFKLAVQGSELSKLGLIEVLNKQFPKSSKGCIKNTLEVFAKREGGKEAEKRWVWREEEGGVS
jgi:chromatin assembly factor 1 subunit A